MSTLTFQQALMQVEAQARSVLDGALHERLSCAVALVNESRVFQTSHGVWQVESTSTEDLVYTPNGTCECKDFQFNDPPKGWCKHRLAVALARRVQVLMTQPQTPVVPSESPRVDQSEQKSVALAGDMDETTELASRTGPVRVARKHVEYLKGADRPFIKFAGLLLLAHERGLVSLKAEWTYNDENLSLARAVAVFPDNKVFEECGDSTPQNAKNIGLHWRRMSLTRAKARALRDALGLDVVSVEEMD